MMKLTAFRIRNFRSIVDTGWQNLSPDNITCLIGQNESGKTSVLEGLKVFHSGIISEDVLRSDLSYPEVSCRFTVPEGWLLKITDNPGVELTELLSRLTELELTRKWIEDFSSVITVSGEISKYLDSLEEVWRRYLSEVTSRLEHELNEIGVLEAKLDNLSQEESVIRSTLAMSDGNGRGFRFFRKRAADQLPPSGDRASSLGSRLSNLKKEKEEILNNLAQRQPVKRTGDKWKKIREKFISLDNHLQELSVKLEERHQKMTLLLRPFEEDPDYEWKGIINDYRKTRSERDLKKTELERNAAESGYIIDGLSEEEATLKVDSIIQSYKSQYNSEILGRRYFERCPVFELFEDFGSLLPNRIDMEDIISGNEQVEGYKAARNFLSIAQLDYTFFQQPSSRILKQKIENLNYNLTRNFHDFWQQSIGSNNKIHIQFELEHYNSSYGAKAGKPYLEFWIKDEGERLYPKQRSRGVRWFLSFYMELKASAGRTDRRLILLVDEPGVSLHARAQEDVLKVFDDIKDRIQIIYTTHSPHLVEINKLHRVLAVQRDDMDSMKSNTRILDPLRLSAASPDTLTPLQGILGNPMAGEGFSAKRINLIVNDTGSFYMLNAIILLTGFKGKLCVIPSTNVSSIPLLCNILMGWGMEFAVLIFENDEEVKMAEHLANTVFKTETGAKEFILRVPDLFLNSEDLLSTLDFKTWVLNSREGITVANSDYIKDKELPRNFLLSRFLNNVKEGKIKAADLDEETNENFRLITDLLRGLK
jgi:predicted ATP-dependent endonuclease of OLD family